MDSVSRQNRTLIMYLEFFWGIFSSSRLSSDLITRFELNYLTLKGALKRLEELGRDCQALPAVPSEGYSSNLCYSDLISTDTFNNKPCRWYEARIPITGKHDHLPHS